MRLDKAPSDYIIASDAPLQPLAACKRSRKSSARTNFEAAPCLLDAAAAKALAAIIVAGTQGADALHAQMPLQTIDRGESWLVKGTPYTDVRRGVQFCFSHVMLRKNSAEVVSIGSDVRMILTDEEKKHWHQTMSNEQFDWIFGPRTYFEEGGPNLAKNLAINSAFYGGLINKPVDAIAYAKIIMSRNPRLATVPEAALRAEEREAVWHITVVDPKSGHAAELMSFSRTNGKVLSGNP